MRQMEFRKRLLDLTQMSDTFVPILRRMSLTLVNRSNLPLLIQKMSSDNLGFSVSAQAILKQVSQCFAELYKNHVAELWDFIRDESRLGMSQ